MKGLENQGYLMGFIIFNVVALHHQFCSRIIYLAPEKTEFFIETGRFIS
jgi:hypothetical protein